MFTKNIEKIFLAQLIIYVYINFVYSNNQRSTIGDLLSDYKYFVHLQFPTIKNNSTTPESTYILINEMRFVFLLLWSKEQNILHCKK